LNNIYGIKNSKKQKKETKETKETKERMEIEAKQEYTTYLINVLTPTICSGFRGIFEQAKKINNGNSVFKNFQLLLANVPGWNNYMLEKEVGDIIKETGCSWLDDLLTAVFVSHSKILAAVKVGNFRPRNKKIDLKIPETANFVHLCYIHAARDFYKNPMLFVDDSKVARPEEILKNQQMIQGMVKEAICDTIRKLLPFKDIVNQYLAMDNNSPLYIGDAPAPAPAPPPPPQYRQYRHKEDEDEPLAAPLLSLTGGGGGTGAKERGERGEREQKPEQEKEGEEEEEDDDFSDERNKEEEKGNKVDNNNNNNIAHEKSEKSKGKVLDLNSVSTVEAETKEEVVKERAPDNNKYESIDSMTVQHVVSKIQNEIADKKAATKENEKKKKDDNDGSIMSVGMTELQGVLQDGGTIQGFNNNYNMTKTFLPQKLQAPVQVQSNNSKIKKSGANNIKKIVVKYSGGEMPLGKGKKKQAAPKAAAAPPTLIDDAADVDSSEYLD
jgi:hypothetical protein